MPDWVVRRVVLYGRTYEWRYRHTPHGDDGQYRTTAVTLSLEPADPRNFGLAADPWDLGIVVAPVTLSPCPEWNATQRLQALADNRLLSAS